MNRLLVRIDKLEKKLKSHVDLFIIYQQGRKIMEYTIPKSTTTLNVRNTYQINFRF
jgi:hypothetical protein